MSDYSLLKVFAEAAESERLENGHRWPEVDECDWFDTGSGPEYEYLCSVSPTTVLVLLSENESLHKHWQNESNNVQVMLAELIKIKAENESLRKDADKWKIVENTMERLQADEQDASIWSVCSRILISTAHKINAATSTVTEEGVTSDGVEIGDWRVTVERISSPENPS